MDSRTFLFQLIYDSAPAFLTMVGASILLFAIVFAGIVLSRPVSESASEITGSNRQLLVEKPPAASALLTPMESVRNSMNPTGRPPLLKADKVASRVTSFA